MKKFLFSWIYRIPFLAKKDISLLKSSVLFLMLMYFVQTRLIWYVIVGPLILIEKPLKVILFFFLMYFIANVLVNLMGRTSFRMSVKIVLSAFFILLMMATLKGILFCGFSFGSQQFLYAQLMFFLMMVVCMLIGGTFDFLRHNYRLLLVLFVLTSILMAISSDIHLSRVGSAGFELQIDEDRYTDSAAYILKGILNQMPFFVFCGFFCRKLNFGLRLCSVATAIPYFYFLVYQFKFRTGLAFFGIIFLLIGLNSIRSVKVWQLFFCVAIAIFGVFFFLTSNNLAESRERMLTASESNFDKSFWGSVAGVIKAERFEEARTLFEELSPVQIATGKGLGSYYDASMLFGEVGYTWRTIHLGLLIGVLYGGIPFAIVWMLLYLLAIWRKISRIERSDGFLVACKCYVILELIHNLLCPLVVFYLQVYQSVILFMAMGALYNKKISLECLSDK